MLLKGFLQYLQFEKRYSPLTVQAYASDLEQCRQYLQQNYKVDDPDMLSADHRKIRSWVVSLMMEKRSAKTVNRKISSLKTYYRFLLKKGVIKKNPMVRISAPKIPGSLPIFLGPADVESVFRHISESYPAETERDLYVRLRDAVIMELLYGTGIRRAELLGLRNESVDFGRKTLRVLGKGNKERILPLGPNLLALLQGLIARKEALFPGFPFLITTDKGGKAYANQVYRTVWSLLPDASTLTRKSPHVLRHTFATHLSNNGAGLEAVKELLGHSSLASTQVYTHNTIERLKEIHRTAHPKG